MTTARRQTTGALTQLGSQAGVNLGSALAGLVLPVVGTLVVVATRQLVTAMTVVPIARPRIRQMTFRMLWPAIALGLDLALMNLCFYESVARLGLGMAAPIEYLGPLAIAIAASRRRLDFACAVAAGAGVFLLVWEGGDVDPFGVLFGLGAAVLWAGYILLTRTVAVRLRGLDGLAIASMVALLALGPVALFVVDFSLFSWPVVGLLVAGGILSSALPYSLDTFILRRITPRIYAIVTSLGPVIGAVFGWLILHESFTLLQWSAILLVCAAAATAIATQREQPALPLDESGHTIT